MKKKILIGVVAFAAVILVALGAVAYAVFGPNKPVDHGMTFARTTVIEDVAYVSIYLIDIGGGQYVLVDGGVDTEGTKLKEMLKEKGATIDDVVAVLLTHGHGDHIGAAYGLTNKPLYAHEADVDVVEGRAVPKGTLAKMGGAHDPGLKVTHPFKGGDVLKLGDASIEVFHTPGHTAGNSAFLVDGVLLMGDTAQVTSDDTLRSPPSFFSDDPSAAIASIRALAKEIEARPEKPTVLMGSHGGATENVDALLTYDGD